VPPEVGKSFSSPSKYHCFPPLTNITKSADEIGITVNRGGRDIYGIFRHTIAEMKEYVQMAKEYDCELVLSCGPHDTGGK